MPELILSLKGRPLKRLGVTKPELTIGRDPSDDLQIDNIGISRGHVKIRVTSQGDVFAMDNQSSNGTFVNGKRIQERHKLQDGDEIQLAKYVIQFSQSSGPPLDLHKMREAARQQAESPKNPSEGTPKTLSFSADEIKIMMKAGQAEKPPVEEEPEDPLERLLQESSVKRPAAPPKKQAAPTQSASPPPARSSADMRNLIALGLMIVILLLLLILILLLRRP